MDVNRNSHDRSLRRIIVDGESFEKFQTEPLAKGAIVNGFVHKTKQAAHEKAGPTAGMSK